MTPEEKKARIAQIEARLAELKAPVKEEPGMMDYAMRGLNYAGGLGRAAVAGAMEPIVGKDLVSMEQALKGEVPGAADIMEKAGVPNVALSEVLPQMYSETGEGFALEKGGIFDPTARGTIGLAADIALDPTTYLAAPLKAAQLARVGTTAGKALKLGEILVNPLGEAVGAAGKGISKAGSAAYKSAFKKINEAIAEKTGKGISGINLGDLLEKERIVGNYEQIVPRIEELAAPIGEEVGRFRQYAANRGVMVKPTEFSSLEKEIADLRQVGTPEFLNKANYLQSELDALREVAPKYPSEVSQTQRTLRSYLPKNAWAMSAEDALKTRGIKGQMAALANAEEQAMMAKLRPEEVADFIANKERYGLLRETKDVLKEAKKEANRTGAELSAFDTALAAFGLMQGDPRVLAAAAAKKARDIARLSSTRTKGGLLLKDIGATVQNASSRIPPQVWLEMLRSKPEGEQQ
jgi:hypothetical protein